MSELKIVDNYSTPKLLLIASIEALIVSYPNIVCLPWELNSMDQTQRIPVWFFLGIRFLYFMLTLWLLNYQSLVKMKMAELKPRVIRLYLLIIPLYILYLLIVKWNGSKFDFYSTISCQFFVMATISVFAGHLAMLYIRQRTNEQEIEQLKIENLQSRCMALTNQINPHFFFNSLNGIVTLIRKKDDEKTLTYVDTLSDVFRYILQSDKKGLISLEEELQFVDSFRYLMEIRYANKLTFDIQVDTACSRLRIPVLSLLPLIDNIIMHNQIDRDYPMTVRIVSNASNEIVVSNPIHPKLTTADTNGTGLKNLSNRFWLMAGKTIRIDDKNQIFTVYLPLIE